MPRPKGPEKIAFKVMVTVPTFAWLTAKAKGRPVPTYLAETIEQQAANAAKARAVQPRFKGKK
jgi:hypothetical protein